MNVLIRDTQRVLTQAKRRNTQTTLLGTIGSILLGFVLPISIARPIRTLSDAATRIGSGDLSARVSIQRKDEIGGLAKAFNEMTSALQETTLSKSYVDSILQSLGEAIVVVDEDLNITFCNEAATQLLGYSTAELQGQSACVVLGRSITDAKEQATEKTTWRRKDGESIDVLVSSSPLRTKTEPGLGCVFGAIDITEQERASAQLRDSLREKEVFLKEVHHRVKNNLQIVSSLLNLEASRSVNDVPREFLEESQRRIRSMALIHEQLYLSDDVARIDFDQYVRELADHVASSYAADSRSIPVDIDVSDVARRLDQAVPTGIIINELLSNAFKHAFPGEAEGRIRIEFRQQASDYVLRVTDNGVGFSGISPASSQQALGRRLVESLARQIHGSIDFSEDAGLAVILRFPVSDPPVDA